jgi:hypothetical protein
LTGRIWFGARPSLRKLAPELWLNGDSERLSLTGTGAGVNSSGCAAFS